MSLTRQAPDRLWEHEAGVVWETELPEDGTLRCTVLNTAKTRILSIPWKGPGRRVGYSVLVPGAPRNAQGWFTRRVFWVAQERSTAPGGTDGPEGGRERPGGESKTPGRSSG